MHSSSVQVQELRTHRRLLVSLTLNAGLAVTLFVLHGRSREAQPVRVASLTIAATVPPGCEPLPAVLTEAIVTNPVPMPFRWAMLDTNNARAYVANLRAVDCPDHVLRELLVTKLDRQFRPQLQTKAVSYEPWVGRDRRDADRRREQGQEAGGRREQAALIRELLGYDWNSEVAREWSREELSCVFLGFLTDFKAQQAMAVVMNSSQDIKSRFEFVDSRIIDDEDLQSLANFRRGLSLELGTVLNPQELDELETRAQLGLIFAERIHIVGLDPTGAELRAIMHASRSYEDVLKMVLLERFRRDEEPDNNPSRRAFELEVSTSLGAARFAEFLRAQDKDFRDAFKFAQGQDLPKAVAVTLYQAQRTAEEQRREIASDPAFTPEERKIAFEVLQSATAAAVAQTLGRQFTNYVNGDGRWLKQLSGSAPASRSIPEDRR